ncbi:MAG: hypothetical protein WCJ70_04615 [bacterium]
MSNNQQVKLIKADSHIVEIFRGLVLLALYLLIFVLMVFLPISSAVLVVASLIHGEWIKGMEYFVIAIVGIYTARGLRELLKEQKF